MNIAIIETIANLDIKNYKLANIEANKKYKIDFDIDGRFQIQFA